jgi:hypothetical protein
VRGKFASQVEGIKPGPLAIIEAAQPYKQAGNPDWTPLGLLHRLENADKHRKLLVTPFVFDVSHLPWVGPDGEPTDIQTAVILEGSGWAADAEVHVQLGRRVSVAIKVSDEEGHFLAVPTLQLIEGEVSKVLRDLEPFVHAGVAPSP